MKTTFNYDNNYSCTVTIFYQNKKVKIMAHTNDKDTAAKNPAKQKVSPHEDTNNAPNQPTDEHRSTSLTTHGHVESAEGVKKDKAKQ